MDEFCARENWLLDAPSLLPAGVAMTVYQDCSFKSFMLSSLTKTVRTG
jgi:hypothetical protein